MTGDENFFWLPLPTSSSLLGSLYSSASQETGKHLSLHAWPCPVPTPFCPRWGSVRGSQGTSALPGPKEAEHLMLTVHFPHLPHAHGVDHITTYFPYFFQKPAPDKCTFLKPTYLEQRRLFLWLWVCKQALPKIRHRGSEGWPTPRRGDERHPPRKAWIVLTLHQKRRFQSPCPNPALSANTGLVTRRTTRPLERDRKQRSCPKSNGTSGQPVKDHRRRYTLRQEPSGGAGRGGAPPSLPISTKNETQSLLIFLPKKQQCLIC